MYKNKYIKYKKKYLDLKTKIDEHPKMYGGNDTSGLNSYDDKIKYDKIGLIDLETFPGEKGDTFNYPTEEYRLKNKDLVSILRHFRKVNYPMILPGNHVDTLKLVGPLDVDYKDKFDTFNEKKETREFELIRQYIINKDFPLVTKVIGGCSYKDEMNKIVNGKWTNATDKELGKKSTFGLLGPIDLDKDLIYIGCRNNDNELQGPGVLIVKLENKIYEGRFKNNFPEYVRLYKGVSFDDVLNKYKSGSDYSYIGSVSNVKIENVKIEELAWDYYNMTEHGIGIQYEFENKVSNEPIYEGEFKFGLRHGRGIDYADWKISKFDESTKNIPTDLVSEPKNIFFSTPNEAEGELTLPSASNYYNYRSGKQCANDNREYINLSIDGNVYQTCKELETLYKLKPELKQELSTQSVVVTTPVTSNIQPTTENNLMVNKSQKATTKTTGAEQPTSPVIKVPLKTPSSTTPDKPTIQSSTTQDKPTTQSLTTPDKPTTEQVKTPDNPTTEQVKTPDNPTTSPVKTPDKSTTSPVKTQDKPTTASVKTPDKPT